TEIKQPISQREVTAMVRRLGDILYEITTNVCLIEDQFEKDCDDLGPYRIRHVCNLSYGVIDELHDCRTDLDIHIETRKDAVGAIARLETGLDKMRIVDELIVQNLDGPGVTDRNRQIIAFLREEIDRLLEWIAKHPLSVAKGYFGQASA
ncbi:MAG TPA: hypothetical protein VM659_01460, partial [Dongiaceae bacterium]|nr:hypothetical protein [Dongiaceae bacterium]